MSLQIIDKRGGIFFVPSLFYGSVAAKSQLKELNCGYERRQIECPTCFVMLPGPLVRAYGRSAVSRKMWLVEFSRGWEREEYQGCAA